MVRVLKLATDSAGAAQRRARMKEGETKLCQANL